MFKEIYVAVIGLGGIDFSFNFVLRLVIFKVKVKSMFKVNIERVLDKVKGNVKDGVVFIEIIYNVIISGGVIFLVIILSDNVNRIISNI